MRYSAKTKSCTGLYCYLPNSELIDTHTWHVSHAHLCKHPSTLMCGKYQLFLGMTNTEPNLLSLGRMIHYTLLVICQIFTKCRICVTALNSEYGTSLTKHLIIINIIFFLLLCTMLKHGNFQDSVEVERKLGWKKMDRIVLVGNQFFSELFLSEN